jgi:hypothetical protein
MNSSKNRPRHIGVATTSRAGFPVKARITGHSSITVTQRYCHSQADAIEKGIR